jgi:hypothetical protein
MKINLTFNSFVNEAFRKLGTDKGSYIEIHPEFIKKAEELEQLLKKTVLIEIKFLEDTYKGRGPLSYFGITVAKASGRDSGAYIPPSISLIKGSVKSTGSMKNWYTFAEAETIMRFKIPEIIFEKYKNLYSKIEFKIIDENEVQEIDVKDLI